MSFDRLAPIYRTLELVSAAGKLQRCRLAYLDEIPVPRHILLAGEGHGRFLQACARRFPEATIVVVDASAKMLEVARQQLDASHPDPSRISFVQADLRSWQPPAGTFDLIVTHFFLDCFAADSLATIVANLGRLATPDAHWLLADFQIAPAGLARLRSRLILGLLYRFFRLTCGLEGQALISPAAALERAGFTRHRRQTSDWELLASEWWRRTPRLDPPPTAR